MTAEVPSGPAAVHEVDPRRPEAAANALLQAAAALERGELIVLPTETVYGIASRPDDPHATGRLFAAKRRPAGLSLPVLAPSTASTWGLAAPSGHARRLAAAFWPGPLTLILPCAERSLPWYLGEEPGSVAVRVPDHPLSAALLDRVGPIAATSANLSGHPPLASREELTAAFGPSVSVYLVLAPGAPPPRGQASTVVDLTGAHPAVVRAGPISEGEVRRALGSEGRGAEGRR